MWLLSLPSGSVSGSDVAVVVIVAVDVVVVIGCCCNGVSTGRVYKYIQLKRLRWYCYLVIRSTATVLAHCSHTTARCSMSIAHHVGHHIVCMATHTAGNIVTQPQSQHL
jgi:hypothetical protein